MLNRRKVLAVGGGILGGALLLPACGTRQPVAIRPAGHAQGALLTQHHATRYTGASASAGVPYSVAMPVPQVQNPVESKNNIDYYRVPIKQANVEIMPGLTTTVLGFGGLFGGPTIRTKVGRRLFVTYQNQYNKPVNVHLHGGNVPAASDGHPMDLLQPGASRTYEYPNRQQGATLWYHDHSHHTEGEHVYRGMHGFYLIEDPAEAKLGLPSGEFDVPILLRDAQIDEKGTLVYGFPGDRNIILANGKPQPYFRVAARKYRFRLVNASSERTFQLRLAGAEVVQIGSDGGLLPAPVVRTAVGLSPGERVEIVVDFSRNKIGDKLVLSDETGPVLRFDVTRPVVDRSRVPAVLRPLPHLPSTRINREVSFSFDFTGDPIGLVNGQPYDPNRNDFTVKRGTTEIWRITNADAEFGFPHNFHMHLVQFRVLDRDGQPPTLDDAGLKDTVPVPPGTSVRVQATFNSDYLGRYVYHCHFLEHSGLGMMAQMEIVA